MNSLSMFRWLAVVGLCSAFLMAADGDSRVILFYDSAIPQVSFAAAEIRSADALKRGGLIERSLADLGKGESSIQYVIASDAASSRAAASLGIAAPKMAGSQSYAIRRVARAGRTTIAVLGADAIGAMYGGLDLAEAIRLGSIDQIADSDHSPYIERRGIKFNAPLDVRTPSYSDNSDAAQANIPEMWSFDFWQKFIDDMARHRFNVLTLWNLHPFPSLVKVPEYPDVALDDVLRTRVRMDETYTHSGSDMFRPELLSNVEVVKRMT